MPRPASPRAAASNEPISSSEAADCAVLGRAGTWRGGRRPTIDSFEYDNVTYDVEADVLYCWSGKPRHPAHDDASREGHYLQFAEDGALIAITIVNAHHILDHEGKVTITIPERRIETSQLGAVLAAA